MIKRLDDLCRDELFVTQLNRSFPDNMIDSTIRLVVLITIKVQGH